MTSDPEHLATRLPVLDFEVGSSGKVFEARPVLVSTRKSPLQLRHLARTVDASQPQSVEVS